MSKNLTRTLFVGAILSALHSSSIAQTVNVNCGQTSVALDTDTLMSAANLMVSGIGGGTSAPGSLPNSVAFPINARDAVPPAS